METKEFKDQIKLKNWLLCLIFLISSIIAQSFSEVDRNTNFEDQEKRLLQTIDHFNQAFKECDIEKLESMITDNYTHTTEVQNLL